MNGSIRLKAFGMVGLQAVLAIAVSLITFIIGNKVAAYSVLLGASACVIPSLILVSCLFYSSSRPVKRTAILFVVGEFLKLIISAVLLVLVIDQLAAELLPSLLGFVAAQFGFWFAPLIIKRDLRSAANT